MAPGAFKVFGSTRQTLLPHPFVNIEIKEVSPTRKGLSVALDLPEVAAEHQAVLADFSKQARLPGFRPGKAPANLVARRFGKEIVEDFKRKVLDKAVKAGLAELKLNVIEIFDVNAGELAPDRACTITFTVDLRPEFALPKYDGLAVAATTAEVTDAEVDAVIEGIRAERADFKVVDRPSQKSDYLKLSYEGSIGGRPILEIVPDKQIYGKVPMTWEEVEGGADGTIPGLGLALGGLKVGDKKEIPLAFPAEFPAAPALAGQSAIYAVEALEVRERALPALDEAFFKAQQVDGLDGLKTGVRRQLVARKEQENRQNRRRQVVDALNAQVDFPLPEGLIEAETDRILRHFIEEQMRRGVPEEQFEKDKKNIHDGARRSATARVKTQLILARIADQEKVAATERDIDTYLYREAARGNQKPEKLARDLSKDRDRLRSVQQSIIFDKTLDLLVDRAKVADAPTPS
jgi:trigger factor